MLEFIFALLAAARAFFRRRHDTAMEILAERWVGSCRREILDHVIALNEQHLRRLIRDYVSYHHEDRIHDSLEKDTPNRRPVEQEPWSQATVISSPRISGLHHRYFWRQAA